MDIATSLDRLKASGLELNEDRLFDALLSRDPRFDGQFIAAITSTGIYCRPSCPAPVRPLRKNVRFFVTAAAAQQAGFRSCKRCQPDASPGSPTWDLRGDLVGRAMTLIERGEVERIGVDGVAKRLNVSARHLHRVLDQTVGAGPLALARSRRANLARILLQTTEIPITNVAFAAGFASVRQFNDTIKAVYDRTPTEIRKTARSTSSAPSTTGDGISGLRLWLTAREPIDLEWMFSFHSTHSTPGVARVFDANTDSTGHRRCFESTLRLEGGSDIERSCRLRTNRPLDCSKSLRTPP